jgi:hypothetical protein
MMDRKELVEKMNAAYEAQLLKVEKDSCYECMDAALSVAIDELLGPVTAWEKGNLVHMMQGSTQWITTDSLDQIMRSRRAKLERVKAPSNNAKSIANSMMGVTFTSSDADYIIENVMRSTVPGYVPPFLKEK